MTRYQAIEAIMGTVTDELMVLATGFISREGNHIRDRAENFYVIGSMGLTPSIALGIAVSKPKRKIIALDGDGSLLMSMGALTTVGKLAPENFYHVVLNNAVYGSTGNQSTLAPAVDFCRVARAAGYRKVEACDDLGSLKPLFSDLISKAGPVFLDVRIDNLEVGSVDRINLTPEELTDRFMDSIKTV